MEPPISKSEKKRVATSLQKIAVEFILLNKSTLDRLPLTDNLRKAIIDAGSLKSHGAKRRQAQLIGKLMREANSEAILEAYSIILNEKNAHSPEFHELECWREQLMLGGSSKLTEFVELYPNVDVQKLRQLIKSAVTEKNSHKSPGSIRALFRFLRKTQQESKAVT